MCCYFLNIHDKHKIINIDDEESLSKENISIEDYTKDFSEYSIRIVETKNKIEKEIIEILRNI